MKVLDPGHCYQLDALDGGAPQTLQFVKRSGPGYPGNVGSYPGVILQEVLRVLIDRAHYVNGQIPCEETTLAIRHLRIAFQLLEQRAAARHGRSETAIWFSAEPEREPVHAACGHVGCTGGCAREWRPGIGQSVARWWRLREIFKPRFP